MAGLANYDTIKTVFVGLLGHEVFEIYKHLRNEDNSDTYHDVLDKLTNHFVKEGSVFAANIRLMSSDNHRRDEESIESYVLRLRALGKHIQYENRERSLSQAFVCGVRMAKITTRVLQGSRDHEFTLNELIELAKGYERAKAEEDLINGRSQTGRGYSRSDQFHHFGGKQTHDRNRDRSHGRDQHHSQHRNRDRSKNAKFSSHHEHRKYDNDRKQPNDSRHDRSKSRDCNSVDKCRNCGYRMHSDMTKCPARGYKCKICNKDNHWERMCESKDNSSRDYKTNRDGKPRDNRSKSRHIHTISPGETSAETKPVGQSQRIVSEDVYQQTLNYMNACKNDFGPSVLHAIIPTRTFCRPGKRASVILCGSVASLLIDSGAPINIIDEYTWFNLSDKPIIQPCNRKWFGFGSQLPLEIIGQFCATVSFNNVSVKGAFLVMKGVTERLLSLTTSEELGILIINNKLKDTQFDSFNSFSPDSQATPAQLASSKVPSDIEQASDTSASTYMSISDDELYEHRHTVDELKRLFPSTFSGKLGRIKGYKAKIDLDPNIRPVAQKLRTVAFHLRDAVDIELDVQEKEDILEPVNPSMGPTEWISNLVVIPKGQPKKSVRMVMKTDAFSNWNPRRPTYTLEAQEPTVLKVRLTCDSKSLNKAVKRQRYPVNTVEDIQKMVNGARIFSKLDLTKAFHQLELEESSRQCTTICTHRGLYRYKRLHMGICNASEIFTDTIREILRPCLGQLNMTDDILVWGATLEEHQKNLLAVLARLEEFGLTLNADKCEFYKSEVTFFGLRFTQDGVSPTSRPRSRSQRSVSTIKFQRTALVARLDAI